MTENLAEEYLYFPGRIPIDEPPPAWASGSREIWIEISDGVKIHGLWWGHPQGRPVVLFLHGNAQEVYSWSLVHKELRALECRMLIIDYHGYGKSEGEPSEEGLYADGRGALTWLAAECGVDTDLIIFGKSLGGAVACEVARGLDLKALVLESTFTSLSSVAKYLFPFKTEDMVPTGAYNSIDKLPEADCPVMVIHGTRDNLIPPSEGEALFEAAPGPKELFLVQGAGHNDVSMVAGPEYGARIRRWIDNAVVG